MMKYPTCVIVASAMAVTLGCRNSSTVSTPFQPDPTITQAGPGSSAPRAIEGAIEGLAAPDTIVIGGERVILAYGAPIRSKSMPIAFSDLKVGARSRITAHADGATIRGSAVDVLDDVGSGATLHGTVSGLARDGGLFQFMLGGQLVRGDSLTQVDGTPATVDALRDGQTVDVDSLRRTDYAYARRVTIPRSEPAPTAPAPTPTPTPTGGETTVSGVLGPLEGLCPLLVFPVNGQVVVTNASTVYTGGTCTSLVAGGSAKVTGTPEGNTVVARQITIN
jgi:hypothetical protein